MIGKKLAHYEIESLLGSGGMGEVYQARDSRLGRSVAIKVLPEVFAKDPERLARFEREAKVLASLNHAGIAALYGFEEFDGAHFLVMELVEGETLGERLRRGTMPAEEALGVARQIAEALEAAHERGVVHRDLKPANVKITPEGKVKVLDFGLAKAMESAPANASLSNSPTLSVMATGAGVILGTAAYMSPEQARGSAADYRSDIFSFGCVLYEILAGRQAFQGPTVSDILASVLAREPDLNLLPPNLNPRIHHVLRRCVEKEARRRWHAIADVRVEIETILADSVVAVPQQAARRVPVWKWAIPAILAGIVLSIAAGFIGWSLRPDEPKPITRFAVTLPEGQQFTNTGRLVVAISPDGANMVYVANNRLYLRSMSELEAKPITEFNQQKDAVTNPMFSPDGQFVAFWNGESGQADSGGLKKVAIAGGVAVTLCEANNPLGASWDESGIVFGQNGKGILRVSANGGTPEVLVPAKPDERLDSPQVLPGGQIVLFTLGSNSVPAADRWEKSQIVAQSLKTGERKTLIDGGTDGRYSPTGHIVYAHGGTLFAVRFDPKSLEVQSGATPIIEGVMRATGTNTTTTAHFSFSGLGSLIYIPGPVSLTDASQQRSLALVDRTGSVKPVGLPPGPYLTPRFSPDGKRIAFVMDNTQEPTIWIYELSGASSMRQLTFAGRSRFPVWSPDGKRLMFQSDREGDPGIFWQLADGTGVAERLTKPDQDTGHQPESWFPDGQRFSFSLTKAGSAFSWTFSLQDKKPALFVEVPSGFSHRAEVSPDGRWLAYQSNETGRNEIFVQPFPSTGTKYRISKDGGRQPVWAPVGTELFYNSTPTGGNTRLVAVTVSTKPSFTFGNPVPLRIDGLSGTGSNGPREFDISPDGKTFIAVVPGLTEDSRTPLQIQVVLNWFEDLKRRAPIR